MRYTMQLLVLISNEQCQIDEEQRTLILLSHPHDASRRTGSAGACVDMRAPGGTAGAQDTAVTPIA
eukprot:scaffold81350_cov50-Prasinocladus_malaysianus.AAC.3